MVSTAQEIASGKRYLINKMIKEKREYNSSAELLDEALKKKQIFTTHRFAQNYKFPNNLNNAKFEDYLYENYELHHRCKVGLPDCLREAQEGSYWADVKADILNELPLKEEQIKNDYNQLITLNPCLEQINADSTYKMYDVLRGATYKFGVEEIDYFIKKRSIAEKEDSIEYNINMWKNNKIQVSYMLAPQSREKLSTIIENNNKNKRMQDFMAYREQAGHFED